MTDPRWRQAWDSIGQRRLPPFFFAPLLAPVFALFLEAFTAPFFTAPFFAAPLFFFIELFAEPEPFDVAFAAALPALLRAAGAFFFAGAAAAFLDEAAFFFAPPAFAAETEADAFAGAALAAVFG